MRTQTATETHIRFGDRSEKFKACIVNALSLSGKVENETLTYLLSEDSLRRYDTAFTHPSSNLENCYEYYEFIGDSVVNKCVMHFLARKFSQMRSKRSIKILARVKVNYVSKKWLAHFSEILQFGNFITIDSKISHLNKSVLEDIFESFIGVTEELIDERYGMCTGYYFCQKMIDVILAHFDISVNYNDLFDAKTRLKELFDAIKLTQPTYCVFDHVRNHDMAPSQFNVACKINHKGESITLGRGTGSQKKEAEEHASEQALNFLASVYNTQRIMKFNGIDYDIEIRNNMS
tara:strand:- start:1630 stop:2502 length:873 start_codon:yes stop_codon:yes gene_type:complete